MNKLIIALIFRMTIIVNIDSLDRFQNMNFLHLYLGVQLCKHPHGYLL